MSETYSWITPELFEFVLKNEFENFSKITNFKKTISENFASVMIPIKIDFELKGNIENIRKKKIR